MKKKIFALVLVLILAIGTVPAYAGTADTDVDKAILSDMKENLKEVDAVYEGFSGIRNPACEDADGADILKWFSDLEYLADLPGMPSQTEELRKMCRTVSCMYLENADYADLYRMAQSGLATLFDIRTTLKTGIITYGREIEKAGTSEQVKLAKSLGINVITLKAGDTYSVRATGKGYAYGSSDKKVATVTKKGKVKAVSEGIVAVTLTKDGRTLIYVFNVE